MDSVSRTVLSSAVSITSIGLSLVLPRLVVWRVKVPQQLPLTSLTMDTLGQKAPGHAPAELVRADGYQTVYTNSQVGFNNQTSVEQSQECSLVCIPVALRQRIDSS